MRVVEVEVVQQQQWSMVVQLSSVGTADCGEVVLTLVLSGGCRSSGEVNLVASGPLLTMSSLLTPARAPSPQSRLPSLNPTNSIRCRKAFGGKADALQLGPPDPGPPQPFNHAYYLASPHISPRQVSPVSCSIR